MTASTRGCGDGNAPAAAEEGGEKTSTCTGEVRDDAMAVPLIGAILAFAPDHGSDRHKRATCGATVPPWEIPACGRCPVANRFCV